MAWAGWQDQSIYVSIPGASQSGCCGMLRSNQPLLLLRLTGLIEPLIIQHQPQDLWRCLDIVTDGKVRLVVIDSSWLRWLPISGSWTEDRFSFFKVCTELRYRTRCPPKPLDDCKLIDARRRPLICSYKVLPATRKTNSKMKSYILETKKEIEMYTQRERYAAETDRHHLWGMVASERPLGRWGWPFVMSSQLHGVSQRWAPCHRPCIGPSPIVSSCCSTKEDEGRWITFRHPPASLMIKCLTSPERKVWKRP